VLTAAPSTSRELRTRPPLAAEALGAAARTSRSGVDPSAKATERIERALGASSGPLRAARRALPPAGESTASFRTAERGGEASASPRSGAGFAARGERTDGGGGGSDASASAPPPERAQASPAPSWG
jgi:hypothetical protein